MKKLLPLIPLFLLILLAPARPAWAQGKNYSRLVIFSDLHLPGRLIPEKKKAIETVNAWKDIDAVVALGDIVEDAGTPEEYAFAKKFLSQLSRPLFPIAGNHEYMYAADQPGKKYRAPAPVRQAKLELFKQTFSLPDWRYEKRFGPYLCLFISNDDLESNNLCVMSGATLAWLQDELRRNPDAPTIIFFHAPLAGTLEGLNEVVGNESFVAQPAEALREILLKNRQVFLWVSGHTHIGATNASFRHKVNVYEGQVTDIHNSDMDGRSYLSDQDRSVTIHGTIWTNSLFLYPDRVLVKTYDHLKNEWLEALTREIRPNPKKQGPEAKTP